MRLLGAFLRLLLAGALGAPPAPVRTGREERGGSERGRRQGPGGGGPSVPPLQRPPFPPCRPRRRGGRPARRRPVSRQRAAVRGSGRFPGAGLAVSQPRGPRRRPGAGTAPPSDATGRRGAAPPRGSGTSGPKPGGTGGEAGGSSPGPRAAPLLPDGRQSGAGRRQAGTEPRGDGWLREVRSSAAADTMGAPGDPPHPAPRWGQRCRARLGTPLPRGTP